MKSFDAANSPDLICIEPDQHPLSLRALDYATARSRAWHCAMNDPIFMLWNLHYPEQRLNLAACYVGFTALFGATDPAHDRYKGNFR